MPRCNHQGKWQPKNRWAIVLKLMNDNVLYNVLFQANRAIKCRPSDHSRGPLIVEIADFYTGDVWEKIREITAPREACGGKVVPRQRRDLENRTSRAGRSGFFSFAAGRLCKCGAK
jgi:hypothetical protein